MTALLEPGISVVVPVYRGCETIGDLHAGIAEALGALELQWELIFVDDSSPDASWTRIEVLCASDHHVNGIQMSRNCGQHAALLAGIRAARYDVTVTMDDDLQHRPDTIMSLVERLDDDTDLVYGRSIVEEHNAWRNLTSRLAKMVLSATIGSDHARDSSALRAFKTKLRDAWGQVSDPYASIDVLLSWVTTRHVAVVVPMDVRRVGQSNYTVRKLVRHMVNMLTGYSTRPLRIVTWLGFLSSFIGLASLIYVLAHYFVSGSSVPGFAFLASLISILGGMQLFGLGVIGEYLGRMHVRSMDRPTYVIRQQISGVREAR